MIRPVFGKPLPRFDNPCIALYGRGPAGKHCKTCTHLLRLEYHGKTYRKCDLRKLTHGAGTDHRAKWDSCGKYELKKGETE